MNPSNKGWLKKYYSKRIKQLELDEILEWIEAANSCEEYIYRMVQPTGFMYGHPIRFMDEVHPRFIEWDEKSRIKILMAEAFLHCGLYLSLEAGKEPSLSSVVSDLSENLAAFYKKNFSRYANAPRSVFGKKLTPHQKVEYIIEDRIQIRYDWGNFWTSFMHNSLLFLDLIYFVKWQLRPEENDLQDLIGHRRESRMTLLRLIAAAAHADGKPTKEESQLYYYFLQSARLPSSYRKEARAYMDKGFHLSNLEFEAIDDWLLKKYFLELAILMIWADRQVSPVEIAFMRILSKRLNLSRQELDHSMIAVEGFVLEHWDQVHFLQQKQSYHLVSERLIKNLGVIARKNQRMISQEILESKELVSLLAKSRRSSLTEKEKEKVRKQLIDILKTIPTFALLVLPGSFLTLPIIFKIIPKHILFPSAFHED